jgi:hypothetical protein
MFMASAVFPILGRAAITIISEGCKPLVIRSNSTNPGRDSSDPTFALVKLLDRLDRFHHLVFHGKHLALKAIFADGENSLFHFVEQIVDLVLLFVGTPNALRAGGNDFAQDVFVAHDLEVILHVRRSWNEREKARDEGRAAYAIEKMPITQDLRERDQVDRLSSVPKIDKNVVNRPVRGNVKVFFINFLDAFCDRFLAAK